MYPLCKFEHMGESFAPAQPVATDHPMVVLRPDLFTDTAPKAKQPKE